MPYVTGDKLLKQAVPTVADKITLGWEAIDPHTPLPDRKTVEGMALNLLKTKKLSLGDRTYIDLETMKPEEKAELSKKGVDIAGLEAFADPKRRDKLADAVESGLKTQDNWLTKIGNFIAGFFSWMMSGFSGGMEGLWNHVGAIASAGAQKAVNESVAVAMKSSPAELQAFAPYMGEINTAVDSEVMKIATGKPVAVKPRPEVQPVPMDSDGLRQKIAATVQSSTNEALDDPALNGSLGSLFTGSKMETRKREFKEEISTFAMQVATDKTFKLGNKGVAEMTPDEFKGALREKLVEKFDSMEVTGDDGKKKQLSAWYKDSWIDAWGASASRFVAHRKGIALPDKASEFSGYMADEMLKNIKPEQLGQLKDARGIAELDYKLDINQMLELQKQQRLAGALNNPPSADTPPTGGTSPTGPSYVPVTQPVKAEVVKQ
ncbi:MAG: hypothetical protein SFX19_09010 [Alphaproteobacteria bacterium]|nr:hypothetical protein [Alphaproteobacteria bacterium]